MARRKNLTTDERLLEVLQSEVRRLQTRINTLNARYQRDLGKAQIQHSERKLMLEEKFDAEIRALSDKTAREIRDMSEEQDKILGMMRTAEAAKVVDEIIEEEVDGEAQ